MVTAEEILSLLINSSHEPVDRFISEQLNVRNVQRGLRSLRYHLPSAGKIRSRTLQEDQEFEQVFLLRGNISLDIRLAGPDRNIIWKNMYLKTNFQVGQPSTSNLCINFGAEISYTTHRFRTKKM